MTTKISGKVTRVIFSKDGFFICMVNDTCVSVNHPKIKVGFDGDFTGSWVDHPKFGKQFKAAFAIEKLPETKEGFKHYLMSGAFKGIGGVTADKIIAHLGDNPLEVMNTNLDEILNVPKVKKEILQSIKDTWLDNTVRAEITIFLQQFGISSININKIYESMGVNCIATIMSNPYIIIEKVTGIGFKTADRIALKVGIEPNSELRISECIKYVLVESGNYGNCYLLKDQIIKKVKELIDPQDGDAIVNCINSNDGIMKISINEEDRYYSIQLYYAEQSVMSNLSNMLDRPNRAYLDNMANEETLSSEQRDAVYGALSNNISILTGSPGCGKTYTTKTIVDSLLSLKKKIGICAPTGKAALRSSTVIGHDAMTIHRLLGFNPRFIGGFEYNANNPLDYDYIIVEESSMIDIKLMSSLLDAVDYHTQILFVGDHNQLPPVGAGAPFKDMIESGLIPTFTLNKIFRQGMNSKIVTYAHDINNGEYPNIQSPLKDPLLWNTDVDCLFIDSGCYDARKASDYGKESSLAYGYDINKMIIKLYTEIIKKYKGFEDIQLLIPKRVGDVGTNSVNSLIQDVVNPLTEQLPVINVGDRQFRLNDKVIHVQNNYELGDKGIFNGEIGKIVEIDVKKNSCFVQFDDKKVEYTKSDMGDLELAFAITIHKSQGSEFDCVILPIMTEYGIMLEKSLIYTALTRAKKLAVFIGQRHALMKAVKTINKAKRQTSLSELLIFEKNLVE